jgi:hypothetical protein
MLLPGGVWSGDRRRREYAFRPVTGETELALAEIAAGGGSVPERVTAALAATLAHAGGAAPTPAAVAGFAVADRQYLMRKLTATLGRAQERITVRCTACGEPFDIAVNHAGLPVKEAGDGYPFACVETSAGRYRFRVPAGGDQQAIAAIEDEARAIGVLVMRCLTLEGPAPEFAAADVAAIEAAIEKVAPEAATAVQSACPECHAAQNVNVDPYVALSACSADRLLEEIHLLASTYHWSESEILSLPLARRRRYLRLIDRDGGVAS